jgi:prophage regulatory protein
MKPSPINSPQTSDRMLKISEVCSLTGYSKGHLYKLVRVGKFPAPLKISAQNRWLESELRDWKNNLPRRSTPGDPPAGERPARRPKARDALRAQMARTH